MMKKMVEQWNLQTRGCPDTYFFKDNTAAKIEKNRARSQEAAKESKQLGGQGDARSFVPGSTAVPPPPRAARGGGCPG